MDWSFQELFWCIFAALPLYFNHGAEKEVHCLHGDRAALFAAYHSWLLNVKWLYHFLMDVDLALIGYINDKLQFPLSPRD